MQPTQPRDLTLPVQFVKGVGPKRAQALAEKGITTVRDLLFTYPFDYIDLSTVEAIGNLHRHRNSGKWITVIGTVLKADVVGKPPRQRMVAILGDATGSVQLVFFRSLRYFRTAFAAGEQLAVSGKVTLFGRKLQFVHPSVDRLTGSAADEPEQFLHTKGIVPKYGSSEEMKDVNLNIKGLRRIMRPVVEEFAPLIEETLPEEIRQKNRLLALPEAVRAIHFPASSRELDAARRRLKFDELFTMELVLALRRKSVKTELPGIPFRVESALARKLVDGLPFRLTKAQVNVINEIAADMKLPRPMHRLLQGDVGSGKTVVALAAMLIAVDNGFQAAFMAPTEILAEQHYRTLAGFLRDIPVNFRLLVGGQGTRLREDVLEEMRSGRAQIVVGTHALIQEGVAFDRLGFIVVDEQHRFGVEQRSALRVKGVASAGGPHPDILVMTATPIPRTLSLTLYGDLDVSAITTLPARRKPIETLLRFEGQEKQIAEFLRREIGKGRQAYIVYPLVAESEKMDLKSATESYERLKSEIFSDLNVGLLHGRMRTDEKEEVMRAFKEKEITILVATTVVEVGIDVPNATVMVIQHAERFGLAQLHQLRGRVGRGAEQSYCILVAPGWMKSAKTRLFDDGGPDDRRIAERRIATMLETTDGFKIAEIDLELRGPGDFFGTRQHGLPALQLANLMTDGEILAAARREAFTLIDADPHLRLPEHARVRRHFERRIHDALALLQGG